MRQKNNGDNIGVLCCGQGSQEPEMFKKLVRSENPHVRRSAEEVIGKLEKFPDGHEVVKTYYDSGVDPVKVNNTRYVQPGVAAYVEVLYRGLESQLGYDIIPDAASGYSFGVIPSLSILGVLSPEDMLNVARTRGEVMSPIKPWQFHVMTVKTKEPIRVRLMNWTTLRGTGYRACIRLTPDVFSLSGPLRTRDTVKERLEDSGAKEIPIDNQKFYSPFHNFWEMKPYAILFRHIIRRMVESGEIVFKDLTDKLFITNGGESLRSGKDIRDYTSYPHIVQFCDFDKTVKRIGSLAPNCFVLGPLNLKRYAERGYLRDFYVLDDTSKLKEAARWYDGIMERRARGLLPEEVPQRKLAPSYSSS